ncbi:hypothetical protein G7009_21440 [Pseudomonas capeferrum]|uniref:hypothetical protein n=1 Tax=Pseudomonas capeferrum TaxID=1495066 RepID=UPI0015E36597|nr:hypothetical protein [Pseudomonas capeferrum]MBA1204284.1 hypothetical protein [Pseudomonas capeferrum]
MSGYSRANLQLTEAALSALGGALETRVDLARRQMISLLSGLGLVFLSVLYLYGALYLSVRRVLGDLDAVMQRVAAGEYDG